MSNTVRFALMSVVGLMFSGCGCSDIGCPAGVILAVDAELSVERVELNTPTGWVACPSMVGACLRTSLADGRSEYRFFVVPTPLVEVRAKNAADQVVFDGQLPLVIEKIENDPDACESECPEGRGSLGTTS